jgi:uncharacterized phage protein gp47/JayE
MPFTTPTLDEQVLFVVAHFKALFPDDDVSELSFNYLWNVCLAAAVTDNHAHVAAVKNDILPDTSEGSELRRWAAIRGVVPKTATGARKANALRAVGVAATAIPADTELVHDESGLRFRTTSAAVIGAGDPGTVDLDIAAIDTGEQTRLEAGQVLRFSTVIADVEELAELQLDLDEDGNDAELDGALRLRVLSRFSSPPLGGKADDYEQWALEVTGWEDAYCYPLRAGLGTVDLAALHAGSGEARCPSPAEVAALQAIIDEKRPVSVKQFRILEVTPEAVNVEVLIVPNGEAQFAFDWDDSTPPTVDSWEAGAVPRLVTLTADRPASMKAGDRVMFKPAGAGGTGKERVIESLSSTDAFILEEDLDGDTPAATDTVYAGGPLVAEVREAIQELFDNLGTANPDADRYGSWEGSLRPSALNRVATSVEGVLDGEVTTPAATLDAADPDFPDNGEVGLLIAGRILIRKKP